MQNYRMRTENGKNKGKEKFNFEAIDWFKSDCFSLGIIIFQLSLAQTIKKRDELDKILELMNKTPASNREFIEKYGKNVPEAIREDCLKMMSFEADKRPEIKDLIDKYQNL